MVVQYSNSPASDGDDNDEPAMMIVPPVDQFRTEYTFLVPYDTNRAYVFIIIEDAQRSGIRIDGYPYSELMYFAYPGSDPLLVGGYMTVSDGYHTLTHISGDVKFGAYMYGITSDECAYAYPLGQCLDDLGYAPVTSTPAVPVSSAVPASSGVPVQPTTTTPPLPSSSTVPQATSSDVPFTNFGQPSTTTPPQASSQVPVASTGAPVASTTTPGGFTNFGPATTSPSAATGQTTLTPRK